MARKRYLIEFAVAMAAYAVAIGVSVVTLTTLSLHGPLQIAVALLPMIPAIALCWVIMRYIRGIDEMQQRVQLEAFAFAFAGTALLTFSYGFLESVGAPKQSMFWVWPVMAVLWIAGGVLANRRYR